MGCGDIHGLYVICIIVSSFEKIKFVIFKKDLPCTTKVTVSVVKGAAHLSLDYISFHVGLILGIVKKGVHGPGLWMGLTDPVHILMDPVNGPGPRSGP